MSVRTAIIQLFKEWKVEEEAWQYRELGGAHGILLGPFMGEPGRSLSLIVKRQRAWVAVWIKVVFRGCSGLYTPKTR